MDQIVVFDIRFHQDRRIVLLRVGFLLKFGLTDAEAPAVVGTLKFMTVTRENTALMSRNGTSTTIRFMNVVISNSGASFDRFR
ncbi:MAG: hypothetical protein P8Z70_06550 [Desulfuromonadales bacterium]